MIKGVIFDLGRTLIYLGDRCSKVDAIATAALVRFLRSENVPLDPDFESRFRAARELKWKLAERTQQEQTMGDVMLAALPILDEPSYAGILQRAVDTYFEVRERFWLANVDAGEVLRTLAAHGLRLGAISNSEHDGLMQKAVERLGFSPYLNPVITSAGARWRKPNPRIFKLIIEEWGLFPDEVVMVGDSLWEDIAGAQRVGMRGILLDNFHGRSSGKSSIFPRVKPDLTVRLLAEIPGAIAQIQSYPVYTI